MNRDNLVFATCGLLLGLIIGSLVIGPRIARSQLAGETPAAPSAPTAAAPAAMAAGTDTTGGSVPAPTGANPMQMVLQQLSTLKAQVAKNPNDVEALVQLGNLYMDAAKFPQAAEYYGRALALRDQPTVRIDLGICYRKLGQPEKALGEFQAARTADPLQWQASFNEAIVLADLHRADEARTVARQLAQERPGDPDVAKLQEMLKNVK